MAATTLTGTTGNNILNAPGAVTTLVQGLQGADTITLSLAADTAEAGKGNDSIAITSLGTLTNTISAGQGDDTVFLRSAGIYGGSTDLGAGDDSISFATGGATVLSAATIIGGADSDTIRFGASNTSDVAGNQGDDIITATQALAVGTTRVGGGKNKDSIYFNAATTSFATIQGGRGADTLSFSAAGNIRNTAISGGKGTDSIAIGATTNNSATVAGGGLADTIRLIAANNGAVIYGDGLGTTTKGTGTGGAADGADLIASTAAAATSGVTVFGGGGADTINFTQVFSAVNLVNGGNGLDSIRILDGGASNYGLGSILGGAGEDTIVVGNSAVVAGSLVTQLGTINGGSGEDRIIISGASAITLTSANFGSMTGASNAVISYGAGDRILTMTGIASNVFTAIAIWVTGNPTLVSLSAVSGQSAVAVNAHSGQGNIGVFSDGTDSMILISTSALGNAASTYQRIIVKGVDLQLTTTVGQAVALTSTTFGLTVAANVGGGMEITLT